MQGCGTHVKLKYWVAAIAKATLEMINEQQQVGLELLSINEGAYMVMGNGIFKLDLVDHIVTGTRALPALRKQVLDKARQDVIKITEKAETDAATIIKRANEERQEIQSSLAALKVEKDRINSELRLIPPSWVQDACLPTKLHYPLGDYRAGSMQQFMQVGMIVPFKLKWINWTHTTTVVIDDIPQQVEGERRRIAALPAPPFNVLVWVSLLSTITHDWGIMCDEAFAYLPHMNKTRSCHTLPNSPNHCTSLRDYELIKADLTKIYEEVNLDSPLGTCKEWYAPIHSFIPPVLKAAFQSWASGQSVKEWLVAPEHQAELAGQFDVLPPEAPAFDRNSAPAIAQPNPIDPAAVTEEPTVRVRDTDFDDPEA